MQPDSGDVESANGAVHGLAGNALINPTSGLWLLDDENRQRCK